jgi:hypothetical protein
MVAGVTRFQLFRLSLSARPPDLFRTGPSSKEEYIRSVFLRDYRFIHYRNTFHYLPDLDRSGPLAILGRVGRLGAVPENLPPDRGLQETTHDRWKASVIVIDPTDGADGQKASVGIDQQVGSPEAIFTALIRTVNTDNPTGAYLIEAQPIIDAQSFWDFARQHEGKITTITFEFLIPNGLWSASTSIKEELKQAHEHTRADNITVRYKSSDGLDANDGRIAEAVDYAASGSGKIRAKAMDQKTFNSSHAPKTVTLPNETIDNEPIIARVARFITKVLGRE